MPIDFMFVRSGNFEWCRVGRWALKKHIALFVCLFFILLTNEIDGLVEMDFAGLFPDAPPVVKF